MRGFTLIELLVATSIISVLSVLMLVNYRAGSQKLAEQRSIKNIAQAIHSAQNKALGAEEASCSPSPCVFYGAHLDMTSQDVIVFASNDNKYDAGEELPGETKKLEGNIIITFLSPSSGDILDILFAPPDPTMSLNPSGTSVDITITGGKGVRVSAGGSVDTY